MYKTRNRTCSNTENQVSVQQTSTHVCTAGGRQPFWAFFLYSPLKTAKLLNGEKNSPFFPTTAAQRHHTTRDTDPRGKSVDTSVQSPGGKSHQALCFVSI